MNDQLIKSLWNRAKQQEPKMNTAYFEGVLQRNVRRGWRALRGLVWTYLTVVAGAAAVSGINIVGYASNPAWLAVHVGLAGLAVVFLVYGAALLHELRQLDDPSESLLATVRRQLRFFHTKYELWLWMVALTIPLLSIGVSTWLDNQDGHYRINQVAVFVGVTAAQILFMYLILRLGHYPLLQRTLAALEDLECQATEQTRRAHSLRKYWILAGVVGAIIGTVFLILGILRALNFNP